MPAHGHPDRLERLLAALDRQARGGPPLAVVVSDDASSVPLAEAFAAGSFEGLALEFVRSETNGGPGAARNRGVARVETPWVAFFDSDELPDSGWLEHVERIAGAVDAPDGVEGRIDTGDERATPFTHIAESSRDGTHHVAGNVAFRTEALRALGGFDERYYEPALRLHFREDTELFFRIADAGLRVPYDDSLLAHHPPLPSSFRTPLRDARRYYFDPLLARDHPQRFRAFNELRRVGPVSLRRARHVAALAHAAGAVVGVAALATGSRRIAAAAAVVALASWGANVAALAWGRRVPPRDVVPVALVALGVPWVYLVFYYRGAVRFRHLPRL